MFFCKEAKKTLVGKVAGHVKMHISAKNWVVDLEEPTGIP